MALKAGVVSVAAGVLLLAAGATSSTLLFDRIGSFVEERFASAAEAVEISLTVLGFLASFGGLVVIVGGALMLIGRWRIGRLVVLIAAAMAAVGLVSQLVVLFSEGEGGASWWLDVALALNVVGIGLAFWARPSRS